MRPVSGATVANFSDKETRLSTLPVACLRVCAPSHEQRLLTRLWRRCALRRWPSTGRSPSRSPRHRCPLAARSPLCPAGAADVGADATTRDRRIPSSDDVPSDVTVTLGQVEERYVTDAIHSLSIGMATVSRPSLSRTFAVGSGSQTARTPRRQTRWLRKGTSRLTSRSGTTSP